MTFKIICFDCAIKFDLHDEYIRSDLGYMSGYGTFCSFCKKEKGGRSITILGDNRINVSIPRSHEKREQKG